MPRMQAGLLFKRRESAENPLRTFTGLRLGRITHTYPEHGLVDVALLRGPVLRQVPLLADAGGTTAGSNDLPQIWNSDVAQIKQPEDGSKQIYDEGKPTYKYDSFCVVGYIDGYANRPVVVGFLNPNAHQNSFNEPNLGIDRKASDIHELHWSEDGIDIRPKPFGQAEKDRPPYVVQGNWQQIFPDRQKDYSVTSGSRKFGNDHQTYFSVGYHDRPRVFGNGKKDGSANFDADKVPFRLNPIELGDDQKQYKYARGIVFNQRWRSRFAIDTQGNIDIHAEGLCFDSTDYKEQQISEGTVALWSRLETRGWHKHAGFWTRMRPRFDGKDPESVKTAKETGTYQMRIQRKWDVAVRKDIAFVAKDSFTLNIGDFPSHWNDGDLGKDPGTRWDDGIDAEDKPALNPEWKTTVDDDDTWKGESFQDSGNASIHQNRRQQAKAVGPLTATWLMDPEKPNTDTSWVHTQAPQSGATTKSDFLKPSSGKPADWQAHLDGDTATNHFDLHTESHKATATLAVSGPNPVTLTVTSDTTSGHLHLDVAGPQAASLDIDTVSGTITITAPTVNIVGTLKVNGTTVTVP